MANYHILHARQMPPEATYTEAASTQHLASRSTGPTKKRISTQPPDIPKTESLIWSPCGKHHLDVVSSSNVGQYRRYRRYEGDIV